MAYKAERKQALAHKAFMVDGFKRGVLLWGRQCLAPDTLIRTDCGLIPIADLMVGDRVLSYGEELEYKPVTDVWGYGVDSDPKPMLQLQVDNEEINCTYDHPFYFEGHYIPIYILAWRKMASSQRQKLKLLCQQYGQAFDDPSSWGEQNSGNETSSGRQRLPKDGSGRQDNQDASISSSDVATKSSEQGDSQPQERNKDRQFNNKPGVDDPKRKYSSQSPNRQGSEQRRGELRDSYSERDSSARNTLLSNDAPPDAETSDGKRIINTIPTSKNGHNTRHFKRQDLEISKVRVLPSAVTYSIGVADNHNYCITEKNILVKNSGKTFFGVNHAWISAIITQGRYFIIFSTYKQAHEVVWRQYLPMIPKELIYKTNESDLLIELHYLENTPLTLPSGETIMINHNKSLPRSSIQLLGSDQADSHRGFKGHGMIFDEYADQSPDNLEVVYEPMLSTTNGWIIFMGTPRGYNHFYDLIQFAKDEPNWFYQEATWRDSPYVSEEFMADVKQRAIKRGGLSGFMQEYELEFRSVQGAVYPMFDRKIHVISPTEFPEELTYYGAIDFGWHTTAFLLLGVDKDQTWYVLDSVYGKEETLEDVLPRIKNVIGDKRMVLIVADSANRDAIEIMGKTFPVVGVNKANDTKGYALGIGLVTEKLKPRMQLVGPPKPSIYIGSNNKHLIFELESYRFPEEKPERNPSDIPVKEDDHGPDALRYLFLHLKFGLQKEDKPLKFELEKVTNEYGLI